MMLTDEKSQIDPHIPDDAEAVAVTGHIPDPARDGLVDVVSLRGLVRAMKVLRGRSSNTAFDEALIRVINTNGHIARTIESD